MATTRDTLLLKPLQENLRKCNYFYFPKLSSTLLAFPSTSKAAPRPAENPEKYVIWNLPSFLTELFWAQTHIHLSYLKFEVPQARTACTLWLQKSSNNIKNDLLLRKEDFLLKRQTKGIRLTEIFQKPC